MWTQIHFDPSCLLSSSPPLPLLFLSLLSSLYLRGSTRSLTSMPCTSCHGKICTSCHVLFGLGAKLISIFYIGQAQRMRLGKSFQPVYYTPLAPPMRALPTIFSGITVSACIGPQSCLHVTPNSESTSYWQGHHQGHCFTKLEGGVA